MGFAEPRFTGNTSWGSGSRSSDDSDSFLLPVHLANISLFCYPWLSCTQYQVRSVCWEGGGFVGTRPDHLSSNCVTGTVTCCRSRGNRVMRPGQQVCVVYKCVKVKKGVRQLAFVLLGGRRPQCSGAAFGKECGPSFTRSNIFILFLMIDTIDWARGNQSARKI